MDEKAQKEALKELNKSLEENVKKRNRKVLIIIIYIIIVIIYQTIIGTLKGENPDFLGFKIIPIRDVQTKEKYEININNYNNLGYYVQKSFKLPVIPFLLDIVDYGSDTIGDGETTIIKSNDKFKINYKVFNCFSSYAGKLVNETCDSHTVKYEEINIKHKIKIIKVEFPDDETLYDGEFIEDIYSYVKDTDYYSLRFKYKDGTKIYNINYGFFTNVFQSDVL